MIPRRGPDDASLGRRALLWLSAAAALLGGYYWYRSTTVEAPEAVPATEAPAATAATPAIANPVAPPEQTSPLPELASSDLTVAGQLAALVGQAAFDTLFLPEDLVRRMTVSVDNLPREKLALRLLPIRAMDSQFIVSGEEGQPMLGPENHARYAPYLGIVEAVDVDQAARVYVLLYPLFQQAYQELGNLDGYFNDRVVEVIDHLLATPEVPGPIALVRPKVVYQFGDPALESRSAGQKLLLRMGPDNAARLKTWLRSFRERIASQPPA
jgi:hypothetical protein